MLHEIYKWFMPIANRLKKDHHSICMEWWRSRYHEACGFTGNMNHNDWEVAHIRAISFQDYWITYKEYLILKPGQQIKLL